MSSFNTITLKTEWNVGLIAASCVVATIGGTTALFVMKQRTGASGRRNWLLLLAGAVALGAVGIWGMHFVGMNGLTLRHPTTNRIVPFGFNALETILSMFLSIATISFGFWLAGDPDHLSYARIGLGGFLGGSGVSVMHYTGMMAMVVAGNHSSTHWNAGVIAGSVIIGIGAATAALAIFFQFQALWKADSKIMIAAGFIMAFAVCSMHYVGMTAASYVTVDDGSSTASHSLDGYASPLAMLASVLSLAFVTCAGLVGVIWYYNRFVSSELKKAQCLVLSVIVVDTHSERILCTNAGTLPSIVIDENYTNGVISIWNHDFVAMFKASFQFRKKPKAPGAGSPSPQPSTALARSNSMKNGASAGSANWVLKFITAARTLSDNLGVPLSELGMMYWEPGGNGLFALVRTVGAAQAEQFTTSGAARWAPKSVMMQYLQSKFVDTSTAKAEALSPRTSAVMHANQWFDRALTYYATHSVSPTQFNGKPLGNASHPAANLSVTALPQPSLGVAGVRPSTAGTTAGGEVKSQSRGEHTMSIGASGPPTTTTAPAITPAAVALTSVGTPLAGANAATALTAPGGASSVSPSDGKVAATYELHMSLLYLQVLPMGMQVLVPSTEASYCLPSVHVRSGTMPTGPGNNSTHAGAGVVDAEQIRWLKSLRSTPSLAVRNMCSETDIAEIKAAGQPVQSTPGGSTPGGLGMGTPSPHPNAAATPSHPLGANQEIVVVRSSPSANTALPESAGATPHVPNPIDTFTNSVPLTLDDTKVPIVAASAVASPGAGGAGPSNSGEGLSPTISGGEQPAATSQFTSGNTSGGAAPTAVVVVTPPLAPPAVTVTSTPQVPSLAAASVVIPIGGSPSASTTLPPLAATVGSSRGPFRPNSNATTGALRVSIPNFTARSGASSQQSDSPNNSSVANFMADVFKSSRALSDRLGVTRDLVGGNLIDLVVEITGRNPTQNGGRRHFLLLYVVCAMTPEFPAGYDAARLKFVPLHVFQQQTALHFPFAHPKSYPIAAVRYYRNESVIPVRGRAGSVVGAGGHQRGNSLFGKEYEHSSGTGHNTYGQNTPDLGGNGGTGSQLRPATAATGAGAKYAVPGGAPTASGAAAGAAASGNSPYVGPSAANLNRPRIASLVPSTPSPRLPLATIALPPPSAASASAAAN